MSIHAWAVETAVQAYGPIGNTNIAGRNKAIMELAGMIVDFVAEADVYHADDSKLSCVNANMIEDPEDDDDDIEEGEPITGRNAAIEVYAVVWGSSYEGRIEVNSIWLKRSSAEDTARQLNTKAKRDISAPSFNAASVMPWLVRP